MYSEFHEWLVVYVRVWNTSYAMKHRCPALGHQYYRCGKCKQGLIEVFSERDYDETCPACGYEIMVTRETADGGTRYSEEG